MKKRNIAIITGVIVLVVLLVVARKQGWIGSDNALEVELGEVERTTIVETVLASGKIQPEKEVMISSEVSGEIIELPIEEGQAVKKGDLLLRINPDIYQAAVSRTQAAYQSARAALASAEAQFKEAKNNYERNKKLFDQAVISGTEWDAAQRTFEVARLNVESSRYQLASARASYQEAQDNLKRTTIYAPTDGTVSRLEAEVGERVVGTAQMAGTEIARIANLEKMEVLVEVNENDIIRVKKGDTARIEVDAYLGKSFKGVVTEIANSAKLQGVSADQVTNFDVKVRILKDSYAELAPDNPHGVFRPGMTASVEIITRRKKDVLAVPIEAVTTRTDTSSSLKSYEVRLVADGDEAFEVVFVARDAKAHIRVVESGIQDEQNIEILSGLEEGESIITGPYSLVSKKLTNGDRISKAEAQGEK